MNIRLILFSAVITAGVGVGLGLGVAEIAGPKFISETYRNVDTKYALVGAGLGLVVGGSQEAVRQLKKQRDAEESLSIKSRYHA
jgi:hypothetical protein